jgi:protein transport protein SEC20
MARKQDTLEQEKWQAGLKGMLRQGKLDRRNGCRHGVRVYKMTEHDPYRCLNHLLNIHSLFDNVISCIFVFPLSGTGQLSLPKDSPQNAPMTSYARLQDRPLHHHQTKNAMTSTAQLAASLASVTNSLKSTNTLITRLARLTFPPGAEPLDDEGNSVRIELAQDIHEGLKQLEEDLELLRGDIEDSTPTVKAPATGRLRSGSVRHSNKGQEHERLGTQVVRLGEDLKTARSAFRRAQISAKRAADESKVKERELVFASLQQASDPSTPTSASLNGSTADLFAGRSSLQKRQQHKNLTKDELLVAQSSDVTSALRRTTDLLSTELSRSRFAQETFDESTAALKDLGDTYSDLDSVLKKSRDLLGTLLRSQKSDTWYLETAFYILIATLGWLIFRRILYGPFFKLPLFLYKAFAFVVNWVILKPLFLFLTTVGIITTEPYNASQSTRLQVSSSRAPLIIKPSAAGRPQSIEGMADDIARSGGVRSGAGGTGAKVGKNGELRGEMSEEIGKMAERRGDGTVLQDRGDIPKNPKKKQFEADVEDAKHAEASAEGGKVRKRDEL